LTRSSVVAANTAGPLAATKGSPFDTAKGNGPSPSIEWIPTRIEFENVYRSYGKPDLWRILTSSVPRREFALRDLTLAFGKPQIENDGGTSSEDAVCLLLGASSSGKSTIFRSILEASAAAGNAESRSEMLFGSSENEGSVEILQREDSSTTATTMLSAVTPILLDDRGEVQAASGQSKTTIREAWNECIEEATGATTNDSGHPHTSLEKYLVETLAGAVLDLDPEALLADLTPSEGYRYCLGRACISSSARGGKLDDNGDDCWRLPGPILLLDEWMDVETSAVVRKVEPSLHKIVEELNGVVLSITHKPELYSASSPLRKITLSSGTLLADR
jgi:energy-coupling factor transporter ATP-binding protein EcfA2